MQRLELLTLLALLLLALDSFEASLLARGRSKTKRLREQPSETPYECLNPPAKLPACNFRDEAEDETLGKPSRHSRSPDGLPEPEELSPVGETEATRRAVTIIYKIEGCIPSRLPFVLPLCKTEDSVGRIVEVRRLFPFKVAGPSTQNSGVLPTLVFPELDMDQWNRFMKGPWIRTATDDDDAAQSDKVTREIPEEKPTDVESKKTAKRKKAEQVEFDKKSILQKFTEEIASKEIDENDIFSKFPSPAAVEQHLANDRARDTDSYKIRSSRLNRIVDASQEDGEIGRRIAAKAFSTHHRHEFPYAEAIPYDPEKLRVARVDSEFPYAPATVYDLKDHQVAKIGGVLSDNRDVPDDRQNLQAVKIGSLFPYNRAISYDPKNLVEAKIGSEFPYNRAIPYDPLNLEVAKIGSEFPYALAIPYDPRNLQVAKLGSEFPYSRAITYDPEKLQVARVGSEFPYSRAIPFDPMKLQVAKRGSEFPYTRAIPYNPKKLEERRIAALGSLPISSRTLQADQDAQASESRKLQNPGTIPFDTSMLDAAKDGGVFPYGKGKPDDTSKIVDAPELSISSVAEKSQVPMRHVKTFWDRDFADRENKLALRKEQMRLENIRAGRELQENLITTWNDEDEASVGREKSADFSPKRIARRSVNVGDSRDDSTSSDSLEIPSRWSEFPYSKAIPFDPEKLRRPRSSMEYYLNRAVAVRRHFARAKATTHDSRKHAVLRRKNQSETQSYAAIHV